MSLVLTAAVALSTVRVLRALTRTTTARGRVAFARATGIWELTVAAHLLTSSTPPVMVAANAGVGVALLLASGLRTPQRADAAGVTR